MTTDTDPRVQQACVLARALTFASTAADVLDAERELHDYLAAEFDKVPSAPVGAIATAVVRRNPWSVGLVTHAGWRNLPEGETKLYATTPTPKPIPAHHRQSASGPSTLQRTHPLRRSCTSTTLKPTCAIT